VPELPDVEVFKNYCRQNILDRKIDSLVVKNNRVIKSSPATLRKHLEGETFRQADRHGKYLFLATGKKELVLHFGMTGSVRYIANKEDIDHSPFIIDFNDGSRFAFITIRKFGKVMIVNDRKKLIDKNKLGPDAYGIDKTGFQKAIGNGGTIKYRLMNQKRIAGIGNIYADEILYQTSILPERTELDKEEVESLFADMKRIFDVSIRHGADPDEFPFRYLIKRRKQGENCGICAGRISKKTINGRSSYFCDRHQK
jgi:formamidopyrimidine-DNA glycosylase